MGNGKIKKLIAKRAQQLLQSSKSSSSETSSDLSFQDSQEYSNQLHLRSSSSLINLQTSTVVAPTSAVTHNSVSIASFSHNQCSQTVPHPQGVVLPPATRDGFLRKSRPGDSNPFGESQSQMDHFFEHILNSNLNNVNLAEMGMFMDSCTKVMKEQLKYYTKSVEATVEHFTGIERVAESPQLEEEDTNEESDADADAGESASIPKYKKETIRLRKKNKVEAVDVAQNFDDPMKNSVEIDAESEVQPTTTSREIIQSDEELCSDSAQPSVTEPGGTGGTCTPHY